MAVQTKIQLRRDNASVWTSQNPTLAAGEIGFEVDTLKFKVGNGSNTWSTLKYSQDASLLSGTASITALTTSGNVTVGGNLTVNGTTTSINSSTLQVDDKNIELGSVAGVAGISATVENGTSEVVTATPYNFIVGQSVTRTAGAAYAGGFIQSIQSPTQFTVNGTFGSTGSVTLTIGGPSDTTADGAGLTVLGNGTPNNKTFNWVQATAAWTSNQDFDLASGKVYEINGTTVLSNTQVLGYSITNAATASTIVARDSSGNFLANTITATLFGTANLATNMAGGSAGQLLYQSAANVTAELAVGTNNQILIYNTGATAPAWATPNLSNTFFGATTSAQLAGVISDETGSGNLVFATSPTLVTPALGTPSSGNLVSTTGYTVDNLANTTANVITFLKTPSSANFLTTVTGATGNGGGVVFANNATLVAPTLGVATATSLNKVTFTAPATSATLTLANGSTFQTIGAFFINATASANTDITFPTSGTLATQTYVGSATVAQANNITANAAQVDRIAYASATNTTAFLAFPAANNYILTANTSGAPFWAAPASTGVTSLVAGNGITVSGSTGAVTVNTNASYATTWTTTQRVNVSSDVLAFGIRANTTQTANLVQVFAGDGTTTLLSLSNVGTLFATTIDGGSA